MPASQMLVAFLWEQGLISPDPNGPLVQPLEAASSWEVYLGPIGIVIAGVGARLTTPIAWFLLIIAAIPTLLFMWFIGAAWLGGLAGEPF